MAGRFEGKVALVTGAASGIGRATAAQLVREGARVVAADVQDDKGARLEETFGAALAYVHCDVLAEDAIASACRLAAERFGGLDILVNNAGHAGPMEFADTVTAESFDAMFHLHLRAAFFGLKHAAPLMRERSAGAVVSTASVAGLGFGYGPILYSVAKAALIHMTKLAAVQLAPWNIRVNCVCPGATATAIFGKALGQATQVADATVKDLAPALAAVQPLKRSGEPEDIAEGIAYLASDAARFVTGHALVVDGGLTLGQTGEGDRAPFAPVMQALGLDPELLRQFALAR